MFANRFLRDLIAALVITGAIVTVGTIASLPA